MVRYIFGLLLIVAACSGSPINPVIIGGSDADITDYPYLISIEYQQYGHYCGGFIISSEWAMTDASCTFEPADVTQHVVRSGSTFLGNGTLHNVTQWIHHPEYIFGSTVYDFALIKVDPPFEFGENVAAVPLAGQDEYTPHGASALIAGWGIKNRTYDVSTERHLQVAQTFVWGEVACSEFLGFGYQDSKLCVQDPNGVVVNCYRDEGGPLVIDGKVFGIILWTGFCADPEKIQIYSRIASVREWIDATIAA